MATTSASFARFSVISRPSSSNPQFILFNAAPRTGTPHSRTGSARFRCLAGQTGFFTKLGRLIKEKAKSDVEKLFSGFSKTRSNLAVIDELLLYWNLADTDRVLDELEEALLVSDFGPRITIKIVENLREDIFSGKLKSGNEIKEALKRNVLELLTSKGSKTELQLGYRKPAVIMIVGVNGGGKTTSLGKLAYRLKNEGAKILMAAGDTFRAAASDQLEIWAERTGCEIVVAESEKAKASSVLSQAVKKGKELGFDIVLCDTSGRLHTNYSLMEELISCKKSVAKVVPGAPNEILLVLDGTTGLNMLPQAREFNDVVGVTGLVLTKLDGSARGGTHFHQHSHLTVPFIILFFFPQNYSIPFKFFHHPFSLFFLNSPKNHIFTVLIGFSACGSMSTVSKDDNLVLSSEDSSCPEESELELGLGLSLSSGPSSKSHHHHVHAPTTLYARIYTAKDFPSSAAAASSSPSSSSSSSPNITAGTKRAAADSLVANNRPSQVVGWPPLRTYRVNSFNSHAKSTEVFNSVAEKSKINNTVVRKTNDNDNDNNINAKEKRHLRSSLFVKVNMDGIPIGRKVDLSAHSSYETLAQTLEDMFNESTTVTTCKGSNGEDYGIIIGGERHSKLLDGSSKFVLTYEDKEGDWMLVGDVPWGMFLSSVRRLRIMRTSEANGLAPRLEENIKQRCKPI